MLKTRSRFMYFNLPHQTSPKKGKNYSYYLATQGVYRSVVILLSLAKTFTQKYATPQNLRFQVKFSAATSLLLAASLPRRERAPRRPSSSIKQWPMRE
eukprot:187475-Amphidinium_carterae.1